MAYYAAVNSYVGLGTRFLHNFHGTLHDNHMNEIHETSN